MGDATSDRPAGRAARSSMRGAACALLASCALSPLPQRSRLHRIQLSADQSCYVAIRGLRWEEAEADVRTAAAAMLPPGFEVDACCLPVDKKGRTTGRALLALRAPAGASEHDAVSDAVESLAGQYVGSRWLEAEPASAARWAHEQRESAANRLRVERLAPQAHLGRARATRGSAGEAGGGLPKDERHVIILCHETDDEVCLKRSINALLLPPTRLPPAHRFDAARSI